MPDDDLERRVRKLSVEHAETRWLTLRIDDDIKEIHATQRKHTARLDSIDGRLDSIDDRLDSVEARQTEHTARFDSVDSQFRSLIQLVGQVLRRLPEDPAGA